MGDDLRPRPLPPLADAPWAVEVRVVDLDALPPREAYVPGRSVWAINPRTGVRQRWVIVDVRWWAGAGPLVCDLDEPDEPPARELFLETQVEFVPETIEEIDQWLEAPEGPRWHEVRQAPTRRWRLP